MNAANADKSARLLRVLGVLADGAEHSTLDIQERARVCAVGTIASELRANGHKIITRRARGVWLYCWSAARARRRRSARGFVVLVRRCSLVLP